MIRYLRVPAAGAIALALFVFLPPDGPSRGSVPPTSVTPGSGDSIGCTVKLLNVGARRLEVIVGVGHALRIVRLELSPRCGASARGQRVPLEEILPGDVVRVHYESAPSAPPAPGRRVATRIDLVLATPDRRE